jgi:hypothetical protein
MFRFRWLTTMSFDGAYECVSRVDLKLLKMWCQAEDQLDPAEDTRPFDQGISVQKKL